jgi:lysophospholipase L1-like esterase
LVATIVPACRLVMARRISLLAAYCAFVLVILELALRLGGLAYLYARRQAPDPPSQGEFRILAVGESTTFGVGVAPEAAYPQQLERMLNENGDKRYVVINTGVPGQTSTSILRSIRYQLDKYRPHVVITQMGVNDLNDMLNDLSSRVILGFYVPEPIAALHVFRLFMVARDFALVRWIPAGDGAWRFFDREQRNPDGSWRQRAEFLEQLELNYGDIIDTIRASGARVIMLSYLRGGWRVCRALRVVAQRKGAPLVEFASGVRAVAPLPIDSPCQTQDDALFTGDGFHPNEEGHRRIAAAIREAMAEQGF